MWEIIFQFVRPRHMEPITSCINPHPSFIQIDHRRLFKVLFILFSKPSSFAKQLRSVFIIVAGLILHPKISENNTVAGLIYPINIYDTISIHVSVTNENKFHIEFCSINKKRN